VLWVIAKLIAQNYKNYLPLIDWKKRLHDWTVLNWAKNKQVYSRR